MSRELLLKAILADPEDDAPRLVYADWLEEHGDESDRDRAEFIRLQIERARLPEYDPRRPLLKSREQELLDRRGVQWRKELPTWLRSERCWFRRGFVAVISATAARFGRGRPLSALVPLEGARLRNLDGRTAELAASARLASLRELAPVSLARDEEPALLASPHLAGLRRLDLTMTARLPLAPNAFANARFAGLTALNLAHRSLDMTAFGQLLNAPFTAGLEELDLSNTGLPGAAYRALSKLESLRTLRLQGNPGQDEGARALAAGAFPHLAVLDLSENQLTEEGMRFLTTASWSAQLRSLGMQGTPLRRHGLRTLTQASWLSGLVELSLTNGDSDAVLALASPGVPVRPATLDLSGCLLFGEGMRALSQSALLAGLWHLNLSRGRLDSVELTALLAGSPPPHLATLNLNQNALGAPGAEALARSGWLSCLTFLTADNCKFGDAGAAALASVPEPVSLCELSLALNHIGPAGARALASSPLLAELRYLDLSNNPLGDEGVIALASSGRLTHLQRLNLESCGVGTAGLQALAQSAALRNLAELDLLGQEITSAGADALLCSPHLGRLLTVSWYGAGGALYERFDIHRNLHID